MENIRLAEFTFDTDKLQKSLSDLREMIFDLKKEQEGYSQQNRDLQKSINDLNKQKQDLIKDGKQESEQYKTIQNSIKGLVDEQKKIFASQENLKAKQGQINAEYKQTNEIYKTLMDEQGKVISVQERLELVMEKENVTINQIRKNNSDLMKIRNDLNLKDKKHIAILEKINKKLDENNERIKKNSSEIEKQKINIGNYTESIKKALSENTLFKNSFNQVSESLGGLKESFGSIINILTNFVNTGSLLKKTTDENTASTKALDTAQKTTSTSTKVLSTGMKVLRGALLSLGLPLILVLLGSLISYLTTTQEGINKVNRYLTPLKEVFATLLGVVQNVGKAFVEAFQTKAIPTFKAFAGMIKTYILFPINQVKGVFNALGKAISGDLKGAVGELTAPAKEVIDSTTKGIDAVADASKGVVDAIKDGAKAMKESVSRGQEIQRLQEELDEYNISYERNIAELQRQLKEQNDIAEDTNKTHAERIEATKKAQALADEMIRLAEERNEKEVELIDLKQKANDTDNAGKKELEEAKARRDQEIKGYLEMKTTQRNKENSINKQQHSENLKRQQEAFDNELKKQQELLDLWLQQQGTRKLTLQEELDFLLQKSEKERAILDKELQGKKISQIQYQTEVLKIQQEIADKQIEITITTAQKELELLIENNQSKLQQGQILTDEVLKQELDREQLIFNEREKFNALQFENGLINETEYQENLLQLKKEYLQKENELKQQSETQLAEQEAMNGKLKMEAKLQELRDSGALEFEIKQAQLDYELENNIAKLEEQKEKGLITEENYNIAKENLAKAHAEASKQIEEEAQAFKLNLANQTFGSLAKIFGEESQAGKAMAIAQTTIDTYQSAVAAYKAMAGIGVIGPALGAVASASAIASGLATVKKITATPIPKANTSNVIRGYATGGEITDGFPITRSNGDDVLITAKRGEVILNEQQKAFIGTRLLSLAGVPGFANGGVVGGISASNFKNVQDNFLNIDTQMIADAVKQGAKEGSIQGTQKGTYLGTQQGMIDLSENRTIQQNASF